jgi:hypothetical protein
MERCLYTYVELNHNAPEDDRTASLEHIIPYALGGCDAFAITYCSKKANNDYGRDIDAPFIALPVTGFKRHSLGLKSYSRTVPDIIFKGDCPELNKKCNVVFPYQGDVYADFGIEVVGGIHSGQISFAGSEDRLRGAITSLLKKASRNKQSVLSDHLQPITSFEDALQLSRKDSGQTLHFRIDFGFDALFVPWSRGVIKMALGLGAFTLGPTWAFSPEADVLRACLVCESADLLNQGLRGSTVVRIPPDVARMIDVQPGRHTLAVLPHEGGMAAYISLFGGEMFDGVIDLGNGPADVKQVNDHLPSDWNCVYHIDPVQRKLTTMSLSDINARLGADEI